MELVKETQLTQIIIFGHNSSPKKQEDSDHEPEYFWNHINSTYPSAQLVITWDFNRPKLLMENLASKLDFKLHKNLKKYFQRFRTTKNLAPLSVKRISY